MTTVKVRGTTAFMVGCRKKTRALAAACVPVIGIEGETAVVAVTVALAIGVAVAVVASVAVVVSVAVVAAVEVTASVGVVS